MRFDLNFLLHDQFLPGDILLPSAQPNHFIDSLSRRIYFYRLIIDAIIAKARMTYTIVLPKLPWCLKLNRWQSQNIGFGFLKLFKFGGSHFNLVIIFELVESAIELIGFLTSWRIASDFGLIRMLMDVCSYTFTDSTFSHFIGPELAIFYKGNNRCEDHIYEFYI